ncbi:MAG: hypothetical protein HUK22_07315 [Thermoguttaceae bacterium]|nr:hypothetical protein [Thermoguttaceae bacterium]
MKFFIAGIMQGSIVEASLHSQNYREDIRAKLAEAFPDAEIYDPLAANQNSLFYTFDFGKNVFLNHNVMCGSEIDVLIAYLPEASMGTAVEIWEAWKNGAIIIVISPLAENWVVKFLSSAIYPDLPTFFAAVKSRELADVVSTGRQASRIDQLVNAAEFIRNFQMSNVVDSK